MEKMLKAIHQGELDLNSFKLTCAILNDEHNTRVFSDRSLSTAFGIKGGGSFWKKKKEGSADLPEYLSASYLKPYISKELIDKFNSAYSYISKSNVESTGVDVTILSDICDVYIKAEKAGVGGENIKRVAERAYSFMVAFSKVGIIALVDEATGYQFEKDRAKDVLQQFLRKALQDEATKWIKTFDDEFFEMIFKMKGWHWLDINQKPGVVGKYINDIVYSRIAPNLLQELRERNPSLNGKRPKKHHQYLTADFGHPKLKEHLSGVMALGRASGYDWNIFNQLMNKSYPKFGHTIEMNFPETLDDMKAPKQLSKFNSDLKKGLDYNPNKDKKKPD